MKRLAAVAARGARAVRWLWPDRNPLRRPLDRVEAMAVGVLAVTFLTGAPLAAVAAQHAAYAFGARVVHAQQSWRQVDAVLLTDVPVSGYAAQGAVAPARWTGPDGVFRTGTVPASPGAKTGSTVKVWIDGAGKFRDSPPLHLSQVESQAVLAAVLAATGLGLVLLGVGLIVHWRLDRRRLAGWDVDWQNTEPQWTRRH